MRISFKFAYSDIRMSLVDRCFLLPSVAIVLALAQEHDINSPNPSRKVLICLVVSPTGKNKQETKNLNH